MAISREREYLADSDGVALCKDPFAMAEGLYKISHRFRGGLPDTYSALFIMNPRESGMDEKEGLASELFSNHPPVSKRLSRLLRWANSDLERLEKADQGKDPEGVSGTPPARELKVFRTYQDNQWVGPYSPQQLLTLGSVTPATWICPLGSQEVVRASEVPELLVLFQQQIQGMVSKNHCPRCKVSLLTTLYEGAQVEQCSFCKGYLLRSGVLERLISREERVYSLQEIQQATLWRDSQVGPLKDRDPYPEILCPYCGEKMGKGVHSVLTQVVIDHCTNEKCAAVWCDGGELETIQMLIEEAHAYLDKVS
jgi:Zn-finger nucleic acid-binding protein